MTHSFKLLADGSRLHAFTAYIQAYSQDVHEKTNTDEITDPLDLSVCSSVVYEERGSIPGVKFVNKGQLEEVWTPVVKGNKKSQ